MKISLTAFTDRGEALAVRITEQLNTCGEQAEFVRCGKRPLLSGGVPGETGENASRIAGPGPYLRASEWTAERFAERDALIFVGAAGIAVRQIAPHIASKTTDPAVVVIDEAGRFVIPILSGHLGGANALALRLASMIGGQAVITTATDVNGVFAFDDWARRMNCEVENADLIREVSGALLMGETVSVYSDFEISGRIPCGVELGSFDKASVCITIHGERGADPHADACSDCMIDGLAVPTQNRRERKLRLIPRVICAGIGCRRGTPERDIEYAVLETLWEKGISSKALAALASIDLKAEEAGIIEFAQKCRVPFLTFSAEKLREVPGEFTGSEFVRSVTGVDNVCERAASCFGELICRKRVRGGVTVALAQGRPDLRFEPYCP